MQVNVEREYVAFWDAISGHKNERPNHKHRTDMNGDVVNEIMPVSEVEEKKSETTATTTTAAHIPDDMCG